MKSERERSHTLIVGFVVVFGLFWLLFLMALFDLFPR